MTYFRPQRSTDSSHNRSRGLCYHTAMIITKRFWTKHFCKILHVSPVFKVLNSTYWPLKSIFLKKRSMLSFHTLWHSCKHLCAWHYQKLTLLRKFFSFLYLSKNIAHLLTLSHVHSIIQIRFVLLSNKTYINIKTFKLMQRFICIGTPKRNLKSFFLPSQGGWKLWLLWFSTGICMYIPLSK